MDAVVSYNDLNFKSFDYRPFDTRVTFYSGKSRGLFSSPQPKIMHHFFIGVNIGLALCKQFKSGETYQHVFITKNAIESSFVSNKTSEITSVFPLYLYDNSNFNYNSVYPRIPNLKNEIVVNIANKLNLAYIEDEDIACDLAPGLDGTLYPLEILDYIYAVLHSPTYREKYKEFLKIDFPRIPYPKDLITFRKLTELGSQIRQIHLLESPVVEQCITQYPIDGSNEVIKTAYIDGKVFINDSQYFNNVPQVAWNFYIGGYQPAQKWLKDRKGRKLEFEDIQHYQKIIVALTETDQLMKEIDKVDFL